MKPNFALSLSFGGIKLLHRAAGGWREVGEVPVSSEDLPGELAILRKTAASLEPGGVRSKLIIPSGQIKYLTLDTQELSDAARRQEAEAELERVTPYKIADLAYDISLEGAQTHVAAVARETLAEAEAFATEHRFHPVSFVAVPDDAPFLGEPFFGTTEGAAALLGPDETVEPDGIAVVIVGTALPDVKPAEEQLAPIDPPEESQPKTASQSVRTSTATAQTPDAPEPDASDKVASEADTDEVADAPQPADQTLNIPAQDAQATTRDRPSVSVASATAGNAPAVSTPDKTAPSQSAGAPPSIQAPATASQKPSFDTAPNESRAVPGGFSSRRSAGDAKPLGGAQRSVVPPPKPDSSSLTRTMMADEGGVSETEKTGFLSRRKPRKGTAAPIPTPVAAAPTAASEADRMTVFGARSEQIRGKPRFLGLIMTVILLVFLVGVAAWAAVFLDDGLAGLIRNDERRTTASAPENQIDPEIIRTPDERDDSSVSEGGSAQVAALDPVLSTEDPTSRDAQNAPPEQSRPILTKQQATARYAVTGIWPLAPQPPVEGAPMPTMPVYYSRLDQISTANDAIALPKPRSFETDVQMAAVVSPPPFGQRTEINTAGLIVPTPLGVVAPGGYTLVAASPPLKPPAGVLKSTNQPDAEAAVAVVSPLMQFRPKNRPSGLAEQTERVQLGGVTRSELAVFRPSLRPRSIQDRAREADQAAKAQEDARAAAATAAATAALAAQQPTAQTAIQNATRLAAAESKRPSTKPNNFARIVQRAERAAPAAAEETRVATAAPVAPRNVAPSIPSTTSVARSATVKNAINLRRINLIGVYGQPSSRRALVRLSNGRYQKVKVGDRIDGGRVSAIDTSELRYTKGGRSVVLKMP